MMKQGRYVCIAAIALLCALAGSVSAADVTVTPVAVDLSHLAGNDNAEQHAAGTAEEEHAQDGKVADKVPAQNLEDLDTALQVFAKTGKLKRHPLNPWYFYMWGKWHKLEENDTRNQWTKRNGVWYRSPVSNYAWINGQWVLQGEETFHPTNPKLWKVGGVFRRKPRRYINPRWVKGRDGRWWRSKNSNFYYTNGIWKIDVKVHPTNPTLVWRGGRWKGRRLTGGQLRWTKRFGRWWLCRTCHFYYAHGRWVRQKNWRKKNNPFWRRDASGKYVKISPVTDEMRRYVKDTDGAWHKFAGSPEYYWNDKWWAGSPRANDPRWRARTSEHCADDNPAKMERCRAEKWFMLPAHLWKTAEGKPWIERDGKWWQDDNMFYYWSNGSWKLKNMNPAERRRFQNWVDTKKFAAAGGSIGLSKLVHHAADKELNGFFNWFLKSYPAEDRRIRRRSSSVNTLLNPGGANVLTPEPGNNFNMGGFPVSGSVSNANNLVNSPMNLSPPSSSAVIQARALGANLSPDGTAPNLEQLTSPPHFKKNNSPGERAPSMLREPQDAPN